jgi:hypothetical protein
MEVPVLLEYPIPPIISWHLAVALSSLSLGSTFALFVG